MYEMEAQEFARRFKNLIASSDSRLSFFLGAGCSISSGIPAAGALVKRWIPRLKKLRTGVEEDAEKWAQQFYAEYDTQQPAKVYGRIIEELFLTPEERQREIESLMEGKDPAFGYAVLAQLISHEDHGRNCNIVLTTNFDDMVADALYLYTHRKPLVIAHDSLMGFVRVTRTHPLVIKLHGDARLAPRNTELETRQLHESAKKVLQGIFAETGLVFLGYGGYDASIVEILRALPAESLPLGVYWVNEQIPDNEMGQWLADRNAMWVRHNNFDELMILMLNEFDLQHPTETRFEKLLSTYLETFKSLKKKIMARPISAEQKMFADAFERAASRFTSWWAVEMEAEKYKQQDPQQANRVYQEGLKEFPAEGELFGSYATFLCDYMKNDKEAEQFYQKSVQLSSSPYTCGNYAYFLHFTRGDYDKAEQYYQKALDLDAHQPRNLANYAYFLHHAKKDYDAAEKYYQKSVEAAPYDAQGLSNYAIFLHYAQKDYDKAEQFYKRAFECEQTAPHAVNYAIFLQYSKKEYDKAEQYYQKALELDPADPTVYSHYAIFFDHARKNKDKAEQYYQKALELDPNNNKSLETYAFFLHYTREEYDKAEQVYQKAIELEPSAACIASYASMLQFERKEYGKAEKLYLQAMELDDEHPAIYSNYAILLHYVAKEYDKAEQYYQKAIEIDPRDDNNYGNYAIFVENIHRDYDKAEELYRKSLGLASEPTYHLANYGAMLLKLDRRKEGFELLKKAYAVGKDKGLKNLLVECCLYQYAHTDDEQMRANNLEKLQGFLAEKVRIPFGDFDVNVEKAIASGHPQPELLQKIVKELTDS